MTSATPALPTVAYLEFELDGLLDAMRRLSPGVGNEFDSSASPRVRRRVGQRPGRGSARGGMRIGLLRIRYNISS
jgi:hypothetical protein